MQSEVSCTHVERFPTNLQLWLEFVARQVSGGVFSVAEGVNTRRGKGTS